MLARPASLSTMVVLSVLLLPLLLRCGGAYRPVVIIHGVLTGNGSMYSMGSRIRQLHPGTKVYATGKFNGWTSLAPMWHQVTDMGRDLLRISARHPEGVNLIGEVQPTRLKNRGSEKPKLTSVSNQTVKQYNSPPNIVAFLRKFLTAVGRDAERYSQGGLIARTILQQFPNHNVKTFISLSAPQGGQYGTKFLHLFFPNLVCKTAYELFYSALGQHTSVGNYWNDPHQRQLYYNYSKFLPYVNNEIRSPYSGQYRRGLRKLDRMVLIGGPDDGVITPWQSSHFGYYDADEGIVDLRNQPVYKKDTLGLRSLDLEGKLELVKLDGVDHFQWHRNNTVIDNYIVPFLE